MVGGSEHHSLHANPRQYPQKEQPVLWPRTVHLPTRKQQLSLSGRAATELRWAVCPEPQRDHALLCLLYNPGSRIQEALNLRSQDLYLKSPAHVRLLGKGQKERISPIWPETAELRTSLIERNGIRPDERLFINRYGAPLTASGFRFRLRQY